MEQSLAHLDFFIATGVAFFMCSLIYLLAKKFPNIPYVVALLFFGIIFSEINLPILEPIRISPESILFIILPILLFESAFNFEFREFKKVLSPASLMATIGLILSSTVIALGLHYALDIEFVYSFMFGAVVSSTDPIAVLTLFKQLGVPKRLQLLIDGESFLNDGTSVILFKILSGGIIGATALTGSSLTRIVVTSFGQFILVTFGGAAIGLIIGWIISIMISKINNVSSVEILLTILTAQFIYIVAEHFLAVSGIIAVLVGGIVIGNFGRSKISPPVMHNMHMMWDFLVFLATSYTFLMIGYEVSLISLVTRIDIVVFISILALIARMASVYPIIFIYNLYHKIEDRIPLSWQHIGVSGGLRGVLPLIIILSLPDDFIYKEFFLLMVVSLIITTLMVNVLYTKVLIRKLHINDLNERNMIEINLSNLIILSKQKQFLQKIYALKEISKATLDKYSKKLDQKLLKYESQIKEWLSDSKHCDNYSCEIEIVLKNLALQLEKKKYLELYEDKFISEEIYTRLKRSLEDQQAELELGRNIRAKTNEDEIEKEFKKFVKLYDKLKQRFTNVSSNKLNECYIFHKSRLVGNEEVIEELIQLQETFGELLGENMIQRIREEYEWYARKNRNLLKRLKQMDDNCADSCENLFAEKEIAHVHRQMLKEYSSEGRFSLKALSMLGLKE